MVARIFSLVLVVLTLGSSAWAQVLDLPPRTYRGLFGGGPPPDPDRPRQDFLIHGDFLGGYEDNLVPQGANIYAVYPGGYTGFSDMTIRYSVGRLSQGLEITGSGFVNTYKDLGLGPSYGGTQTATYRSTVGRQTSIAINERLGYTPYFSLRLFDPAPIAPSGGDSQSGAPPTQAANPSTALAPTASWLTHISGSVNHSFTRTMEMSGGYSYDQQNYLQNVAYDSVAQAGALGFDDKLSKNVMLRASYRYSSSEFAQPNGLSWPLRTNTIEGGASYTKQLSRTRQFLIEGGVGAVQSHLLEVRTGLPIDDVSPSGYGTVRLDFGRSWSVAADYRRAVMALQGARPESFISNSATISLGGFVNKTMEAVVALGYSSGSNLPSPNVLELGTYDGYNGSAQVRFRLSRYLSALVNASRYQYLLNDVAAGSLGVPPRLDRNAIRFGVTWSLPLVGAYLDAPRPNAGGN
jgi:opacity protein-like surface antigen